MASQPLEYYLRACRRRSGLSQSEVAYLLGSKTKNQVSRYERRQCAPPLRAVLALEALFGAPASEIFAGTRETVRKELKSRARALAVELKAQGGTRNRRVTEQKLQWLVEHCTDRVSHPGR